MKNQQSNLCQDVKTKKRLQEIPFLQASASVATKGGSSLAVDEPLDFI
jgi:hypothetical protein